jgi:hypothetical protein
MLGLKRKPTIVLLSLVLILAFWFLGIDGSQFVEQCPDCGFGRDIVQYRFFTIPIYQRTQDYDTVVQKIATDIGTECQHPKLERWHKHRYWGLLICACPCINGTLRMSDGDSWYDDETKLIIKDIVRTNPSLRDEFAERVLKNHDWEYCRVFVARVRTLRNGETATPQ